MAAQPSRLHQSASRRMNSVRDVERESVSDPWVKYLWRTPESTGETPALPKPIMIQAPAFIALGSNLGDSAANIRAAVQRLQTLSDQSLLKSSLWESTPVDCPPGSPMFVNAVAGLVPRHAETPESLLAKLQSLEMEFGRRPKKILNEARPLDLDLIAFGGEIRSSPQLTLPHPRAHLRKFVLAPLAEIAPELVLPGQTQSVSEILRTLTSDEAVRKLGNLEQE